MYSNYILLSLLPFIAFDLYYGYHEDTCIDFKIQNTNISFPLRTWLKVSGYTSLSAFILPLLTILLPYGAFLELVYTLYYMLWLMFRFAWLVVGSIMFFGYLNKEHLCAKGFNTYMWINLIVGFIQVILLFYLYR